MRNTGMRARTDMKSLLACRYKPRMLKIATIQSQVPMSPWHARLLHYFMHPTLHRAQQNPSLLSAHSVHCIHTWISTEVKESEKGRMQESRKIWRKQATTICGCNLKKKKNLFSVSLYEPLPSYTLNYFCFVPSMLLFFYNVPPLDHLSIK